LRYISSGGAPLDVGLKQRVEALWGLPLHNGYGLTETAPTVATTDIDRPADDDSVGPVVPGAELSIRAIEDGRDLPAGEVGEIWIRGPNVMKGYYRDPEATAAAMTPEGFFRSGDLGRMDETAISMSSGASRSSSSAPASTSIPRKSRACCASIPT
jgi:long-chain acyl-CoA synthetase